MVVTPKVPKTLKTEKLEFTPKQKVATVQVPRLKKVEGSRVKSTVKLVEVPEKKSTHSVERVTTLKGTDTDIDTETDESHMGDKRGKRYSSLSETEDSDQGVRGNPSKIPKYLTYDGVSNWTSFKVKFDSYRRAMRWTDEESLDYLSWCLQGKALDHYSLMVQNGHKLSFRRLMRMLGNRFGTTELPETARAQFDQACQNGCEALEDWADRVLMLATPAYREFRHFVVQREAVKKFCQWCTDKEAGKYACLRHPSSMEEAWNFIKEFQYTTSAMESGRRKRRPDEVQVNVVDDSRNAHLEKMVESLTEQLAELKSSVEEEIVTSVHRVCAGSSSVNMMVGDVRVTARIDSGAEITILSTECYNKLSSRPAKVKEVSMQLADKDVVLKGFVTQPVEIQLGKQSFKSSLYVAPISDELLLGHDLLHHLGVSIDWLSETLVVRGEHIPLQTQFKESKPKIARVTIAKRLVVPPNSVVRVSCKIDRALQDYIIEPSSELSIESPRVLRKAGTRPVMSFVNATDHFQTFKKGKLVANAYEV
ncbi:uncharacterized protein LOC128221730 [Mya arenaria]|uniref:uncharacterized protein LOC128221730 n=1 Tax=Mya arenaria TaxID=6604 RepID=UPI0022E9618B|nr:uncharacterized protein LOC128221730 [Mya arenaria]